MSYLLEALKRIEERRQDREDSDLLTSQGRPPRRRRKRAIWPYVLSAALLANAAVVVWLVGPLRTAPPGEPAVMNPSEAPSGSPEARPSPMVAGPVTGGGAAGKARVDEVHREKQSSRPKQPATPTREPPSGAAGRPKKENLLPSEKDRAGRDRDDAPPLQARRESARVGEGVVGPGQGGQPAAKPNLPEPRLSLHSYSDEPKSRLARIDERTVREGDTLATGAVVEEITPDGVVINDKGSKLHLKVQK